MLLINYLSGSCNGLDHIGSPLLHSSDEIQTTLDVSRAHVYTKPYNTLDCKWFQFSALSDFPLPVFRLRNRRKMS